MRITPRNYARSNRIWEGTIPVAEFSRLPDEFNGDDAQAFIRLEFYLDEQQRSRMKGRVALVGELLCQTCLNHLNTEKSIEIDACILSEEEASKVLDDSLDIIECEHGPVDLVDLIEDDLLLGIPWKACEGSNNCLDVTQEVQVLHEATTRKTTQPFRNLRALLEDSG